MKWVKRLLIATAVLVLLAVGLGLAANIMRKSTPDWYRRTVFNVAAREAASQKVEDKFSRFQGWAGDHFQWGLKQDRPAVPTDPTTAPAAQQSLSLNEDELNAFFSKWTEESKLADKYTRFVSDPVLVLQDGRIIVAGTIKDIDTLVSVHLEPKLVVDPTDATGTTKKLKLELVQVMGGRLPLPRMFWDSYSHKLEAAMSRKIEQSQRDAKRLGDGTMNNAAIAASMNRLLLDSLLDETSEPVIFLPKDLQHWQSGFPVRITDLKIVEKTLTMVVVPMDAREQTALLAAIKKPLTKVPEKEADPVAADVK